MTQTPAAMSLVQRWVISPSFSLLSAKMAALGPPALADGIKSALPGIAASVPL